MSIADRWLLPDGVDEVLPPDAAHLEALRRRLLDLFGTWGYELVITPMVEYLESLLTGTGEDLDLKTFKVTDRVSGRLMGIRADMTPQVARIDAHSLGRDGITRLCYAGTILHATADNMLASRTPISVGAELFGDSSSRADLEIVSLMIEAIGGETRGIHVELGDVGIFRELEDQLTISVDIFKNKRASLCNQQMSGVGAPGRDAAEAVDHGALHAAEVDVDSCTNRPTSIVGLGQSDA